MRKRCTYKTVCRIDCYGEVQSTRLVGPEDRMGFVEKTRCNLLVLGIEPREVNNVSKMSEVFVSCSAARLTILVHLHLLKKTVEHRMTEFPQSHCEREETACLRIESRQHLSGTRLGA